jgi:hypothetical protein
MFKKILFLTYKAIIFKFHVFVASDVSMTVSDRLEDTSINSSDVFVHFYTVHHFHYTYVPAGGLTLKYLIYTVLVSTQHFLKTLKIFIRNVFKKNTG